MLAFDSKLARHSLSKLTCGSDLNRPLVSKRGAHACQYFNANATILLLQCSDMLQLDKKENSQTLAVVSLHERKKKKTD